MLPNQQFEKEAQLLSRFAQSYRARLAEEVRRLNRSGGAVDPSLRLCVEVVDMLLASNEQMARLLSAPPPVRRAA